MPAARKRKICVFSGKRGGFGAFVPMMRLIEDDSRLELQILLGDMHTSRKFGSTEKEVKTLFPRAKIAFIRMGTGRDDTPVVRAENLGVCLMKTARVLQELKPDIVLVHGDRGEHLMVAFAALNLGIPVAHTQGGDVSGNIDDIQRHMITKLAHLHFPETKDAAERLIRMGEEPSRIRIAGSTYIDRIRKKMYTSEGHAREKYGLGRNEEYFIIIFHPDTYLSREENYRAAKNVFNAVKTFGLRSILVYPCSDPGYEGVIRAIKEKEDTPHFLVFRNIQNLDFLGLMSGAKALIGNSSSALVEAPYFKLPAVNVGKRQDGRPREENVVDADDVLSDIRKKIQFALTNKKFRSGLESCGYRLGNGRAGEKIVSVLKTIPLGRGLLRKRIAY